MKNLTTQSGLTLLAIASLSLPATGAILSVSGQTTLIGAPANCSLNQLTGTTAFAWNEQQGITLSGIPCDETQNPGGTASPIFGAVSGTFDSHFLHFQGIPVNNASGSVTFDGPIVGVIWKNLFLDISDPICGAFGTVYPTGYPPRGLFTTTPATLIVNANVLTFNFTNSFTPQDLAQVRVLTHPPAPAPGAGMAMLAGVGLLGARRRR